MSCPQCAPGSWPRAVWVSHSGYNGICDRHRTTWELVGDAPSSIPRRNRPTGYRDVDQERAMRTGE
jgi:hypothetical protein